jgi:hypothetical protein
VSDEENNKPDELAMLKKRATIMGIKFSNNIGLDALRAKVNAKIEGEGEEGEDTEAEDETVDEEELSEEESAEVRKLRDDLAAAKKAAAESEAALLKAAGEKANPLAGDKKGKPLSAKMALRQKVIAEAMQLVRCRITNLDPKKKDLHGEILCVGNRYIGTVKKFIPYGDLTEDGFHLPKVLYDELNERKFLHIQTKRNKTNGQIDVRTSYAKEFSLEVLPQLTQEEINKLAAAQSAAAG